MMNLLVRKTNIEKEIGKNTKIFGENYEIKIIYKNIKLLILGEKELYE